MCNRWLITKFAQKKRVVVVVVVVVVATTVCGLIESQVRPLMMMICCLCCESRSFKCVCDWMIIITSRFGEHKTRRQSSSNVACSTDTTYRSFVLSLSNIAELIYCSTNIAELCWTLLDTVGHCQILSDIAGYCWYCATLLGSARVHLRELPFERLTQGNFF